MIHDSLNESAFVVICLAIVVAVIIFAIATLDG